MKPLRIFIFFTAVLMLLLLVSVLFPRDGIDIGSDLRLNFIALSDLNHRDTSSVSARIESLLASSTVTDDPESDPGTDPFHGMAQLPGTEEEQEDFAPRVIPANADKLKEEVHRIQFADGHAAILHPYFRNLDQMASGQKRPVRTRILHFGD